MIPAYCPNAEAMNERKHLCTFDWVWTFISGVLQAQKILMRLSDRFYTSAYVLRPKPNICPKPLQACNSFWTKFELPFFFSFFFSIKEFELLKS